MEQVTLTAEKREQTGKGAARKLRAAGKIPGVAYGRGVDPVSVCIDERDLLAVAKRGANVLIDLQIDGGSGASDALAILKEVQRDPVTDRPLGVDLQWISLTERITVSVRIVIEGHAPGVDAGGIMDQSLWDVQVSVLPTDIPSSIAVPVGHLEIGQTIHVRELVVPEGVEVITAPDEPVVTITLPVVEEVPEEEEEIPVEEEEAAEEGAEAKEAEEPQPEGESET
jgi:large subunit ribosomal protein L25